LQRVQQLGQAVFGQAIGVVAVDVALAGCGGAGGQVGILRADVFSDLHRLLQGHAKDGYGTGQSRQHRAGDTAATSNLRTDAGSPSLSGLEP